MKNMINYVVPAWGGKRRSAFGCTNFLKYHIDALLTVKHNIKFVTVCYSEEKGQPQQYFDYIQSLATLKANFTISLFCRPNLGLSYGAFSDAYGIYRDLFEYYVFIEDDYIFVKDNFDEILLDLLDKKKCDYLCGLKRFADTPEEHAGNSVGILKQKPLEDLWLKHGRIPHERYPKYEGAHSQVKMGQGIITAGYKIMDLSPEYGCWSWWHNSPTWLEEDDEQKGGRIVEDRPGEQLFVPVQMIYKESNLQKAII